MQINPFDFERPIAELDQILVELSRPEKRREAEEQGIDLEAEIQRVEQEKQRLMRHLFAHLSPWEKTQMARYPQRPYSLDYIRQVFDDFMEMSGDRLFGNDEAVVGGPALLEKKPVMVIGQQKGRDLKERQRRNFGSAYPEGFRKALRLMKMAEKFNRPIITLVDTPAAEAGLGAEERGISEAIARNLREMPMLAVPIVTAVIGEGGSGGALGIAVGDRVLMFEHATYSVIPPEGCAAILWRDRNRAAEAAGALKLTAQHAHCFGLVDEVLIEPLGGAHRDPMAASATLKKALTHHLDQLREIPVPELLEQRYQKFRQMGRWTERTETVEPE